MTDEELLERVRDACVVLHSFLRTARSGIAVSAREGTYRQLTDELRDAVDAAQAAGVPEAVIFDTMDTAAP
ncbi:hypothetical protein [Rhodococcus opacus]|uniref:Uncharacterized protein n=1 Tax=Rhodococcus opacus TaxID=37919 RepID=A0A2S8IW54_RHOOP|nr:hypothetical protein [Rhodococcus opacus]PQP18978.1 hypothetical protein C5613_31215 [Rhodococcus opacus]